jgi:hypothetical protein
MRGLIVVVRKHVCWRSYGEAQLQAQDRLKPTLKTRNDAQHPFVIPSHPAF